MIEQDILTIGDSSSSISSDDASDTSSDSNSIPPVSKHRLKDIRDKLSDIDDSISEPFETPKNQFRKRKSPRSISSKSSTPTPRGPMG